MLTQVNLDKYYIYKIMSLLYETSKANSRAHCFSCLRYISISYEIYFGMFCFENGTNDAPEE